MDSKLTTRYKSASPYQRPGQSFTSVPVVYGRPQGTVLGPLLFFLLLFFSSPEHKVLMVSSCYRSLSVVVRCASCVNFWLVNTLEATVLVQSSSYLLRMIILTISRSSSNMGHVGSKTRSVGQLKEKPCEHSRGHSFGRIIIKLAQNDHLDNISVKVEYGSCRIKNKVSRSNH